MKKLIIGVLIGLCIISNFHPLQASEKETNDIPPKETIKGQNTVDEYGDVVPIDTSKASVKKTPRASVNSGILRLRCKPSANYVTEYTDIYNRPGYINGYYGGDALFLGMVNNKAKFMISGVIGYMDLKDKQGHLNYQIYSPNSAKSISYYYVKNGELYHAVCKDVAVANSYISHTRIGLAPNYMRANVKYYSYDGNYFYTDINMMIRDINNSSRNNLKGLRSHSINPNTPYFSYYQYLPVRSKTKLSPQQLNRAIADYSGNRGVLLNQAQSFINTQNKYGTNALLMLAHAALESAWGTSYYAVHRNNLFGISAYDSNTDAAKNFASPSDCVNRYAKDYLASKYLWPNSWYYTNGSYGDKNGGILLKWASDPYGGEKVGAVAYTINKNYGNNADLNRYQLAIKNNQNNVVINAKPTLNSTNFYTTDIAHNYPVIVQARDGAALRINSDVPISSRSVQGNANAYVFGQSYGYVAANQFILVNRGSDVCRLNSGSEINTTGVIYSSNSERVCFSPWVANGATSGTTGKSLAMEGIKIKLKGIPGNIKYQTHVSNIGWNSWKQNGQLSNDIGKDNQLEALKITIDNKNYDVYYRAHVANVGWQNWKKNGELAGTTGRSLAMEAVEIKLVKKTSDNSQNKPEVKPEPLGSLNYRTHLSNIGWGKYNKDGEISGTTTNNMEAIQLKLNSQYSGNINYSAHVSQIGWQPFVSNDQIAGTTGRSLAMEAVKINLSGEIASHYDVAYSTYVKGRGWQPWVKNGAISGTTGQSLPITAIKVKLVAKSSVSYTTHLSNIGWIASQKDEMVSGNTKNNIEAIKLNLLNNPYSGNINYSAHVSQIGWQPFVSNNQIAGTTGRSLAMEAVKINLSGEIANHYDVVYSTYVKGRGWQSWVKNGAISGTTGQSLPITAIKVKLVAK